MISLQLGVLVLLCAQNSSYTLLRRYSRGVLKENVSSSAVLLAAEAVKFAVAAFLGDRPQGLAELPGPKTSGWLRDRAEVVGYTLRHSLPMAVPAITYLIMNMLSFKAMELVDATVFAMVAQLKILTTAVFSYFVLGRRLSMAQWRAIFVLTLSVTMITYQKGATRLECAGSGAAANHASENVHAFILGVLMVVLEISLSGWISAYFEKQLKDGSFSVWGRNLQLAFWSIVVYGFIELVQNFMFVDDSGAQPVVQGLGKTASGVHSFLATPIVGGWSIVTFMLVALGGGGGLLVAFVIKYADAVMKTMSTAFALVVVVGVEIMFLGVPADPIVCLSGVMALLGLQYYNDAPKVVDPCKSPVAAHAVKLPDRGGSSSELRELVVEVGCSARDRHLES